MPRPISTTEYDSPKFPGRETQSSDDKSPSFHSALQDVLSEINRLSNDADGKVKQLASGKSENPHDAMIALEKADVAFQLMNAVRSKIVNAYQELMRTQV
jgi:flagellar hook-basal body complex protein FliE